MSFTKVILTSNYEKNYSRVNIYARIYPHFNFRKPLISHQKQRLHAEPLKQQLKLQTVFNLSLLELNYNVNLNPQNKRNPYCVIVCDDGQQQSANGLLSAPLPTLCRMFYADPVMFFVRSSSSVCAYTIINAPWYSLQEFLCSLIPLLCAPIHFSSLHTSTMHAHSL